jgi:UDP-xylose/UDP-N-acetylglucosamine transporter B4
VRQIASVLLVMIGVFITSLSAAESTGQSSPIPNLHVSEYFAGIILLTLALLLSGLLGLLQEYTYNTYRSSRSPLNGVHDAAGLRKSIHPPWRESLFYLHFLAMPFFLTVRSDILAQLHAINNGPHIHIPVHFPPVVLNRLPPIPFLTPADSGLPFGLISQTHSLTLTITFPRLYIPLILNTLTQLLCVAGVNRLTTSVSNLTVTLVLTVRKAVSLMLSVLLFRESSAESVWLWAGAGSVLVGTVGYSLEMWDRSVPRLTKGKKRV